MVDFEEITKGIALNPLHIREDTPFTQSVVYGKWQEMAGRKVRRFEIKYKEEIIGFFQVIKYSLPLLKSILYIPHGPVFKTANFVTDEFLKIFRDELLKIGKEEKTIFVRFDFFSPLPGFSENGTDISKFFIKVPSYAYHSFYFQPKFEWRINILKTEEELMNEMHPKNRYNIRLAEKKGVTIEIVKNDFEKYFEDFYRLMEQTAKRDNFSLHSKNYYKNIFKTLDLNNSFLLVARYDNNILLVNLILLYGKIAYFIFGGSSDNLKNLMFSHLAQWESMKEAKKLGFSFYNFGGVDLSTSLRVNNGSYKTYEGISVFKKRFGGEIFEYSDSYDIVLKPMWYYLYNIRKRLITKF